MSLKRIFIALLFLLLFITVKAQSDFVRGADVSWGTEMEASGKKFYTTSGQETELFALMKAIGMNAVRLRVWVNPLGYGYGAWCDQADVVNKATAISSPIPVARRCPRTGAVTPLIR